MLIEDNHPSFQDHPSDEESVWRYMDLARYLSLLQSSSLHFANAAQMSDRWEGSFSPVNVALRPKMYGDHFEAMFRDAALRRQYMLERLHMNCWHQSEIESAAMWDIYQREGRGVAVRSTWGRLKSAITSERAVYGAKVKYVDYQQTFIPEGNVFDAFLFKRESFAHEREVRLVMMTGRSGPNPSGDGTSIDLGPEPAILPVEVNLNALIEAVYVAPGSDWLGNVIDDVTRRYGFEYPVRQSDLAVDPIA